MIFSSVSSLFIAAAGAWAGVTISDLGLPNSSWPNASSAPKSIAGTNPIIVSGDNGAVGSPNSGVVAETISPGKVDSETFTPTSTFKLGAISFVGSGSPTALSLH
jgi:hypothetical protein